MKDRNYPYIRAWGRFMGSQTYYINCQVSDAYHENAPAKAIHRNADGTWATVDDIRIPQTKATIINYAKELGAADAE